jgi:hypothetical protein
LLVVPEGLPLELTPFAFLVGKWSGSGVISYTHKPDKADQEFTQSVEFSYDNQSVLGYVSKSTLSDGTSLPTEVGFWRLAKTPESSDHGPGLLPGTGAKSITTHEQLETLRNKDGGFDIEVSILHPSGISELYIGQIKGARVDLATDAVLRSQSSKDYRAATRMFGLVEGALLWVWDIAALGNPMASHASARLERAK